MTNFALLSDASRHLLRHGFTDEVISGALERIGVALGVDRVYIFENSEDPTTGVTLMSQRYEWSASQATPQVDNPRLQNLPYSEGTPEWEGIFSQGQMVNGLPRNMTPATQELLESQDIRSILVCPIRAKGECWGFVGFDDCHTERVWPAPERLALQFLEKAFAGALRRHDPKQLPELNQSLRDSLERFRNL